MALGLGGAGWEEGVVGAADWAAPRVPGAAGGRAAPTPAPSNRGPLGDEGLDRKPWAPGVSGGMCKNPVGCFRFLQRDSCLESG